MSLEALLIKRDQIKRQIIEAGTNLNKIQKLQRELEDLERQIELLGG